MPKSADTIYNSNFNDKTNLSENDLFCKMFTK